MSEQLKQIGETTCLFRLFHAYAARNAMILEKSFAGSVDLADSCEKFANPMLHVSVKQWAENYTALFPGDYVAVTNGSDNRAAGKLCKVLGTLTKRLSVMERCAGMLKARVFVAPQLAPRRPPQAVRLGPGLPPIPRRGPPNLLAEAEALPRLAVPKWLIPRFPRPGGIAP